MSSAATQNERLRDLLGWKLEELGLVEHASGDDLVESIAQRQRELGVADDGICGAKTYSAALAARQAMLITSAWPGGKLEAAGLIALCEAKRAWLTNIVDLPPPTSADYDRCQRFIDNIIRSSIGLQWDWLESYQRDRFEFCGAFLAYAWNAAGMKLYWRQKFFSSTYRLARFLSYRPFEEHKNPRPPEGPYRMMIRLDEHSTAHDLRFEDGSLPRAGDFVIVGGVDSDDGKHICVAEELTFENGVAVFTTIEGNGTGLGPHGRRQHGVSRARRRVGLAPGAVPSSYFVRIVGRPAITDLVL